MELSRRNFLKGTTAIGGLAALGGLVGCAPSGSSSNGPDSSTTGVTTQAAVKENDVDKYDVVGTYTCDFCSVGIGYSGMAAMVQACELGAGVVGIEQSGYPGGGACGIEGVFSLNSSAQSAAGYHVEPVEYVSLEMNYTHGRVNGLKWMDLAHNSGDDVDWLIEQGVNLPEIKSAQCFYSADRVYADYTPHMVAKLNEYGATLLCNTTAKALITNDEDVVTGVIAQKATGEYVRVNAGAVLIATGGFAQNVDYLREAGYFSAEDVVTFIPGFKGDGITLARAVGADDILYKSTALQQPTITGAPGGEYGTFGNGNAMVVASRSPNNIWVNESGERFCSENGNAENWMALIIPQLQQEKSYSIYDRAAFEQNFYGGPTAYDRTTEWQYPDDQSLAQFEDHFKNNTAKDCVQADSIEELCKKAAEQFDGMDADLLLATIQHYNEMCAAGEDSDFGKEVEYMQEFKTAPFYMIYTPPSVMVTYGALADDRKFRVLDKKHQPISGLYTSGNDACDLWPNIYTINVQCGTSANHIYGARTAAQHACSEYIVNLQGDVVTEGDTSPCVIEQSYDMPSSLHDGTYTSDTFPGMFGDVSATVTVKDEKIADIQSTNEMETEYVGVYAIADIIEEVMEKQDVNVDTVAGATASSNAIRNAIEDALSQSANA